MLNLLHHAEDLLHRQRRAALDELFEILPVQKLHDDVKISFVLDEVVDGDDVRVVQLRSLKKPFSGDSMHATMFKVVQGDREPLAQYTHLPAPVIQMVDRALDPNVGR